MFRLPDPGYSFEDSIDSCIDGIAAYLPLRSKLINAKVALASLGDAYAQAGQDGGLTSLAPFLALSTEELGGLTREELLKLYSSYFVPEGKPGRRIYDGIMNAAHEKCPYCGGIGTPRSLDHFLPKAHFPQFSVLPTNLVPACRDCNMEWKHDGCASVVEGLPLQPYSGSVKFFEEQWIFASYQRGGEHGVGNISYYAMPPDGWPESERARAINHFDMFGLARRYSVKAAEHLLTVERQIALLVEAGLTEAEVRRVLLEPGANEVPFINHWKRPMYQALM